MSQVQDALALDPGKYGHVSFLYPDDGEPWVVLNAGTESAPLMLGFADSYRSSLLQQPSVLHYGSISPERLVP